MAPNHVFRTELDAVMLEEYEDDPEVVHAGATASAEAGDDVGLREGVLDSLADAAQKVVGERGDTPGSASPRPDAGPPADEMSQPHERMVKCPRVDPPVVDGAPGQAIREDTPGYIANAFPNLFPHGVGDYHGDRSGLRRTLCFEEWDRCLML